MAARTPKYVQISSLSPELQDAAVAHLERLHGKVGPVTRPSVSPSRKGLLWCGHAEAHAKKDADGVECCSVCCAR